MSESIVNTGNMPKNQSGLYIHVPFCSGKCHYCDFYSLAAPSLRPKWLEGLKLEIELYRNTYNGFDTLYLGGGTPGLLSLGELESILATVHDSFSFSSNPEITLEANPEDVNPGKTMAWQSLGVNRISLGVQSLYDSDLVFLGRRHTSLDALRAIEVVKESGISLSIDLIYGIPGQNIDDWSVALGRISALEPEHISCYQLTVEPGTVFGRMAEKGELIQVDEETQRRLFLETSKFLKDAGYDHYEVSNFAKDSGRQSWHNSKYWNRKNYLGLGPSAHSFWDEVRWWNHRSVRRYHQDLLEGRAPLAGREELTGEQILLETIYLGLRTGDGLGIQHYEKTGDIQKMTLQWQEEGLARIDHGRLVLTAEGLVVADRIAIMVSDILEKQLYTVNPLTRNVAEKGAI